MNLSKINSNIHTNNILMLSVFLIAMGCTGSKKSDHSLDGKTFFHKNLVQENHRWRTAVDDFGSSSDKGEFLIEQGVASATFTIAQREAHEEWTPWVELICDIESTLEGAQKIIITYQCDTDLLLKLSQKDFGEQGNETYAHYQYRFPASQVWMERTIDFSGFRQPEWTPEIARGIPLSLENTNAIYLVPDLDPVIGESARLKVKKLMLK